MSPDQSQQQSTDKPPAQQQQQPQPQSGSSGEGANTALERLREWETSRAADKGKAPDRPQ